MNRIRFTHNWNNKLNNNIFTTIRTWNADKDHYYSSKVDKPFLSILNGKEHSWCELLYMEVDKLKNIPRALICADVGKAYDESMKVFKKFGCGADTTVIVLTFKRMRSVTESEGLASKIDFDNIKTVTL